MFGVGISTFEPATQWPLFLIGLAVLALLVSALVMLCTWESPRAPLAALVGITAGLQTAQLASIHVCCFAVGLWLVFGVPRERRGRPRFGAPLLVLACTAVLASTAVTGTMVNSRLVGVQLMLLCGTAACLAMFGDRTDVRPALLGLLATTSFACLEGVLQFAHILPYHVFLGTRRPIGLYSEPDWLGTFSAIGLVLAYRTRLGGRAARLRAPLLFLHFVVLLLALARAAWIAVVVAAALGLIAAKLAGDRHVTKSPGLPGGYRTVLVGVVLMGFALVAVPAVGESLTERLAGMSSDTTEVGAMARQQQTASLLELDSQSPVVGLGLSASGRVGVSGRISYLGTANNNVASNWILGWWVDGGVLAVPLILLFLGAALPRLRCTSGLVLVVVLVSSLFSNATLIPIAWFALGLALLGAAEHGLRDGRPEPTAHPPVPVPAANTPA